MSKIVVKIWCEKCAMFTTDDWELHEDRDNDMFYQMGLTDETLKQSLARLTIIKPTECNDNEHKFKHYWTGADSMFMACLNCPVQYDINTDPAGDFSGAGIEEDR